MVMQFQEADMPLPIHFLIDTGLTSIALILSLPLAPIAWPLLGINYVKGGLSKIRDLQEEGV